ncbi:MAG: hypothetical protein ACK6DZ_21515 [Acidobacteriota bacterium]
MASQNQIEANRQNAQASTGPRSPAGKLTVSRNALRHGLTANSIDQIPAHVEEAYLRFRDELLADFHPATADELHLFEQMAFACCPVLRAEVLHITALEKTHRQQDDAVVFGQLSRIQRYMRGLEDSARETSAAFQGTYSERCAAVDIQIQDIVIHEFPPAADIRSSASLSCMAGPEVQRVPAKDAALGLVYLGQHRLHAFEQADCLKAFSREHRHHE